MKKSNFVTSYWPCQILLLIFIWTLFSSPLTFSQDNDQELENTQESSHEHNLAPMSSFFHDLHSMINGSHKNAATPPETFSKKIFKLVLRQGEGLKSVLGQLKINQEDMEEVMATFKRLRPEKSSLTQQFSAVIEFFPDVFHRSKNRLYSLLLKAPNNDNQISIKGNGQGEDLQKDIKFEKRWAFAQTTVKENVLDMIKDLKLNADQASNLFQILSYDVDFEREFKLGQHLSIVTEQFYYLNGEFSHSGDILAITMELSNRTLHLYRHEFAGGQKSYFNEDGQSTKHILMKTPIPSALISSNFGMRYHPISDYTKLHKGVDFRAARGTPILAAGEGTIVFRGRKKGYGNYLIISHSDRLQTAYAHISKFAKNLHLGDKVKQGEVVAFVGSTGRATGPHLHYEVIVDRERINPIDYISSSLEELKEQDQELFDQNKEKLNDFIETQLNS